jgi:hypothetical protein
MDNWPGKTAVPPEPGEEGASKISHHIPGIAGGALHQLRADDFKENRPEDGVKRELTPGWRDIARAQTKASLQPKQHRQRARHQEKIIKMKPQEGIVDMGLDAPAIKRIQRARNQEQTIAEIPKFFHSKTRIANPKAAATSSFKTKIMLSTLHHLMRSFQNFF